MTLSLYEGRGKPKWETSATDIQVKFSSGHPFHFTRYSSYYLFLVLFPTRLSRISSIFNIVDLTKYHDDGADEGLMLEPCPIPTSKKEEIEQILDNC